MNKGEFIKAWGEAAGWTNKEANNAYDALFATVTDALKKGDKVQLMGFGSFELRSKPARTGINPLTKKPVKIAACKAPAFKAGKAWKELFN